MLTSAFLFFFSTILLLLTGALYGFGQIVHLPIGITDAIEHLTPLWSSFNGFFPITEIFTVIGWVLVVETAILSFKALNWTFNKIRGSG